MQLKIFSRSAGKKSESKQARRAGRIPAVIYKQGQPGETISVDATAFGAFLRQLKPGYLPTIQLTLVDEKGHHIKAIVKEIQYKVTNYDVIHLDFLHLEKDVPVKVKVPIECTGVADCVGIKQGGFLRQVIRYINVLCKPADIPEAVFVDVKDLPLFGAHRLKDIPLDKALRPLDKLDEVAVVIAKR